MQLVGRSSEKGDTLIEVMISFALFAAIAVTTLAVMNQGTGTVQRALEITLVRAQMDSQIEALQYVHDAYVASYQRGAAAPTTGAAAQWVTLKSYVPPGSTPVPFIQLVGGQCPSSLPANAFIMDAQAGVPTQDKTILTMQPPADGSLPPFSQVVYGAAGISRAYGIWIEASRSPAAALGPPYIDFNIRACWNGAGSAIPVTLGTIVRLYDPN